MRSPARLGREDGQVIIVFTLALVAIVAMTGLVLDGGDTFVQRRDQQNVADAAAMAGAYAYLNSGGDASQAISAAQQVAARNGYATGTNNVSVNVVVAPVGGGVAIVQVDVTKPHRNYFAGVVGMSSWDVTTTATAQTGAPNGAQGAMPLLFNQKAFNDQNRNPNSPMTFDEPGTGTQDVPQTANQFNWTVFCTANGNPCNGDSNTVEEIINNNGTATTITLNMLIGPLNAGAHTTLFSALAAHVGNAYPVAIVDDSGAMQGWALFHLTGSVGGSTKQISGWFDSEFNLPPLKIVPNGGTGSSAYGGYVVALIN